MPAYKITIKSHPSFNNNLFNQTLELTNEQLVGIAIMATAIFGENRDTFIDIRDRALRKIDLNKLIVSSGAIVLDGEAAYELKPESNKPWLQVVQKTANFYGHTVNITKPYTMKVDGMDYHYLIQFDKQDILQGILAFSKWLGVDPIDNSYIRYLHDGNVPMDLNQIE